MRFHEIFLVENRYEHGRYVAYKLRSKSKDLLSKFCKKLDIPNALDKDEYHISLIYSKKDFDWKPLGIMDSYIKLEPKTFFWEVFQKDEKDAPRILVLRCHNAYLDRRYEKALENGGVSDFPSYKQHISVSYDVPEDFDHTKLPTPTFPIYLSAEYQEPLKQD